MTAGGGSTPSLPWLPDVAKTRGSDLAGVDQGAFLGLLDRTGQLSVQVRRPREVPFGEARIKFLAHRPIPVEAGVIPLPFGEAELAGTRGSRVERRPLPEIPAVGSSKRSQACSLTMIRPPSSSRVASLSSARGRSAMWWSERLATTALNGPGSANSSISRLETPGN